VADGGKTLNSRLLRPDSDEVSVMEMERRASVIQSNYFKTTLNYLEEDDERNDKVITY